jgi:hypothetical protein
LTTSGWRWSPGTEALGRRKANPQPSCYPLLRKAEEGVIGKLIVEAVILLSASKQADGGKVLRAAAQAYKVDTDAITPSR